VAEEACATACSSAEDASQSLVELNSAVHIVKVSIRECEQQLKRWGRADLEASDVDSVFEQVVASRNLRTRLGKACETLDRLRENKPAEESRLKRAQRDREHWQGELEQRRQELAAISERIRNLKRVSSEAKLPAEEVVAS